jgi:hypothetical protein
VPLQQAGYDAKIYEAAPKLERIGVIVTSAMCAIGLDRKTFEIDLSSVT